MYNTFPMGIIRVGSICLYYHTIGNLNPEGKKLLGSLMPWKYLELWGEIVFDKPKFDWPACILQDTEHHNLQESFISVMEFIIFKTQENPAFVLDVLYGYLQYYMIQHVVLLYILHMVLCIYNTYSSYWLKMLKQY
jgi:hypothetical protein